MGLSEGWHGCSEGFPEGKAQGKSRGSALPARENPVYPDSFTWIYILFKQDILGIFLIYSNIDVLTLKLPGEGQMALPLNLNDKNIPNADFFLVF